MPRCGYRTRKYSLSGGETAQWCCAGSRGSCLLCRWRWGWKSDFFPAFLKNKRLPYFKKISSSSKLKKVRITNVLVNFYQFAPYQKRLNFPWFALQLIHWSFVSMYVSLFLVMLLVNNLTAGVLWVCIDVGGLSVPHFLEGMLCWDDFTEIYKERADFCFWCRLDGSLDDLRNGDHGAVVWGFICIFGHERVTPCSNSCFWFQEVGGIVLDSKNHVTGVVWYNCIVICGGVI